MFLLRYATRGLIFIVILFVFLAISPIRFPSISITRIDTTPQNGPSSENALPLVVIPKTPTSGPTLASAPAPKADKPQPTQPPAFTLETAKIETAWHDWMARHNVTKSAMALGDNGTLVHSADAGRSAQSVYPVASLSKAVTAMCLNVLLEHSGYSWDTPLSQMTAVWDALAMHPHDALGQLPLSALVTHTSGFPKNIDVDETAGEGRNLYTQIHFARSALRDPDHMGTKRRHVYSNVNFALLGQIIEGLSGQPFGDTCYQTVMVPSGAASASVGGRMWATGGFGGWSISAEDYARFLMHWYGPNRPWVRDRKSYPFDRKSGAGLGVFHRFDNKKHRMNHTGLWRSKTASRRIGAAFVMTATGTVFVANWQGSLQPNAYTDLRKSITAVLH